MSRPKCFVIQPFEETYDRYFLKVYQPAITKAGMLAVRGDHGPTGVMIVDQVWRSMRDSEAVFADISEPNANVYYELGIAHRHGIPTVLAAKVGATVPFDLGHIRRIEYDVNEPYWAENLHEHIVDHLIRTQEDPDNATLQTFLGEEGSGPAAPRSARPSGGGIPTGRPTVLDVHVYADDRCQVFLSDRGVVSVADVGDVERLRLLLVSRGVSNDEADRVADGARSRRVDVR